MRKYVIMGVQGSGKGTQAKLLAEDFDLVHISVGDILPGRTSRPTPSSAPGQADRQRGPPVDDDLIEDVVQSRLTAHDWNFGFIIDGFPATPGRRSSSSRAMTSTG